MELDGGDEKEDEGSDYEDSDNDEDVGIIGNY